MLNTRLTRDAIRDLKHEPACLAAVLLKCIGWLAILTGIVVIGAATADSAPERALAQPPAFKSQASYRTVTD